MLKILGEGKGREGIQPPFPWKARLEVGRIFVTVTGATFLTQHTLLCGAFYFKAAHCCSSFALLVFRLFR